MPAWALRVKGTFPLCGDLHGGYNVSMTRRKKKLLEPMSIRLDPDVKAALQGFAEDEDRSLSSYVNRALREHVERVGARNQAPEKPHLRQEFKKRS